MTYRDTSADITLDNANMATKEQIAKLMADDPATIAERLSGNYIYPGAISPMRTPPIEQEAGREIVRLRAEIDTLKAEVKHWKANYENMVNRSRVLIDRPDLPLERVQAFHHIKRLQAENERLRKDAERYRWLRANAGYGASDEIAHFINLGFETDESKWPDLLDIEIDAAMKDFSTTTKEESGQ